MIYLASLYGDSIYFVPRIMKEGKKIYTHINDKFYKPLYEGIIQKYDRIETWEGMIKKDDIVVYDYNFKKGVESYLRLKKRGVNNIIGGSPFAFTLEHDRAFGIRLLAEAGVLVPDTIVCKNNAEGVAFVKKNEGKYVYKPNGEDTGSEETYMGTSGEDMIDYIQSREDQEFILQKTVEDVVCELGVSLYFAKGKPMNPPAHCIELKRYGSGDKGQNTGCMSSVVWYDDSILDNPTIKATWEKMFPVFEKEQFTGQCDISGIITKDGKFFVLEWTPGRFGYSQDLAYYEIFNEPISAVWESMARGEAREMKVDHSAFGFKARCTIPPYPLEQRKGFEKEVQRLINDSRNTPIIFKKHPGVSYDWVDVKKGKDTEMQTAGCDAIICEVGCKDKDIMKAQEKVLAAMKDISLGSLYYRIDPFEGAMKEIEKLKKLGFWASSKL